ncbi:hypothetical protein ACFXKK_34620 [Streptomyces globisporus]|uniref:hypothetical protein n=1 Tax=Streptomyces globisporus TaxID=1908 RepID=UPI00364AA428
MLGAGVFGSKPDAIDLGSQWLLGKGNRTDTFTAGDKFTEHLRGDHSMDTVRGEIIAKILRNDPVRSGGYSVLGQEGLGRLASGLGDVLTLGWTARNRNERTNGRYGTSTSVFVGSYNYSYEVLSHDSATGKARVEITITNETTINSAVHPPFLRDQWDKYYGVPMNTLAELVNGPMRKKTQKATWTEELNTR